MATKPAKTSKTVVAVKPIPPAPAAKPAKAAAAKAGAEKQAEKTPAIAQPAKPAAAKPAAGAKPAVAAKTTKAEVVKDAATTKPVKPAVEPKPVVAARPTKPAAAAKPKWSEIREILLQMKEETLREISKTLKNGADTVLIGEPSGDIYDQASSERDRELGLLLGDREREKVHAIDEALLRIDEDEYGICEECEEDIPLGRLKAMPFTRHCVKCKSDLEKFQAQTKRFEEERAYREIPLGSEEEDA